MKHSRFVFAFLLLALAAPAFATFHLIKVVEVFPGTPASPNAQYVVLQAFSLGQNLVINHAVTVYDRNGLLVGSATFPASVANSANQMKLLIATPQAQSFFGVTADLAMSPIIPAAGGKVCWDVVDCVAWGGYIGGITPSPVGTPFNVPVGLLRGKAMKRRLDICGSATVLDSCDDTDNSANDFVFATPAPMNNAGQSGTIPGASCGNSTVEGLETCDDGNTNSGDGCSATCQWESSAALPQSVLVDATSGSGHNGNGVIEPNEVAPLLPSWMNNCLTSVTLTGNASLLTGPGGPTYTINGTGATNYGTLPAGANGTCVTSPNPCYSVTVSGTRPATHWDTSLFEVLNNGGVKEWKLHVGQSFGDVPVTNPFYRFVETMLHTSITAGCTTTTFCPDTAVTRAQMAIFLLIAKLGAAYTPPPATGTVFNDVPANAFGAAWIEELARRGITGGCSADPPLYCPDASVTRAQMSVFLLRTSLGNAYTPPAATGIFGDVPAGTNFAPWVEDLYHRGITGGCESNPLMYCPANPNTRAQMSVFLTTAFNLKLYVP